MSAMGFLFGSTPSVPKLPKINLGDQQQQAIADNLAAAPGASKLSQLTQDQIMTMLGQVDPNFASQSKQIGSNISDMLAGKIPTDVSNAVETSSAGRALTGGFGGSEAASNLTARDLGLTSLDLTAKGLSSAESWLSATERLLSPAMATYTGMFVTPQQEYTTANEQNVQQFQRQWMSNQVGAMADPASPVAVSASFCGKQSGMPSGSSVNTGGNVPNNDWASGWETANQTSNVLDIGSAQGAGVGTGEGAAASSAADASMATFM